MLAWSRKQHVLEREDKRVSESQMQPGWYYAQGDAPGTQRYWDGTQWVGGPQPVGGGVEGVGGTAVAGGGAPAEWSQRLVAYLIDFGIYIGLYIAFLIVGLVLGAINESLGNIVGFISFIGLFGFQIWNFIIRQGQMGQTLGKTQQNLRLVRDDSGQPVGIGMAIARWIVSTLLFLACGIPGLLDLLWPLWDEDNKRLTDKILKLSVINA